MLSRFDVRRAAAWLVTAALLSLGGYLALTYLAPAVLPFLLAWGMALLLRPLNAWICHRTRLPWRLVSAVTLLLSLLLCGALLYGVGSRIVREGREAIAALSADGGGIFEVLSELLPSGAEGGLLSGTNALLEALLSAGADALLAALPPLVGSLVLSLPEVILFIFVSVIAAFYFSLDLAKVHAAVRECLPGTLADGLSGFREGAMRLGLGYLRSYLVLTGAIFLVMLLGLSLLGVPYALLLSILLSAVDILPVVGVGTVLVPWGILMLAVGRTGLGVGLILLFAVSEIVRQVLEPRLLGSALGVHPLLSLFSLYLGLRLFGFLGLLLGPLLAVLLKLLFTRLKEGKKTKNPSSDGVSVGHARSTLCERRQREQT